MELVNINQIQAGHVVAAEVTSPSGARLCPAGFKLTEAAIERLINAGVEAVVIEGKLRRGPNPAQRLDALEERFEGIDDPVMLQLKATMENLLKALAL